MKTVKYKSPGAKVYCGPIAVAAVTGQMADVISDRLLRFYKKDLFKRYGRNKRTIAKAKKMRITGTSAWDLRFMAGDKWTMYARPNEYISIDEWAAKTHDDGGPKSKTWYIIETNNHWLAFKNDHLVDTYSKGVPTPIYKHPLSGKKIINVIEMIKHKS